MKTFRQTIIKNETRQTIIATNRGRTLRVECSVCGQLRPMLSAANTALLLNLTERQIFSLVEAGEFHTFETNNGRLFICFNSISEAFEKLRLNETSI